MSVSDIAILSLRRRCLQRAFRPIFLRECQKRHSTRLFDARRNDLARPRSKRQHHPARRPRHPRRTRESMLKAERAARSLSRPVGFRQSTIAVHGRTALVQAGTSRYVPRRDNIRFRSQQEPASPPRSRGEHSSIGEVASCSPTRASPDAEVSFNQPVPTDPTRSRNRTGREAAVPACT